MFIACIYVFIFCVCIIYTHVFSIFKYIHIYPFSSFHETLKNTLFDQAAILLRGKYIIHSSIVTTYQRSFIFMCNFAYHFIYIYIYICSIVLMFFSHVYMYFLSMYMLFLHVYIHLSMFFYIRIYPY